MIAVALLPQDTSWKNLERCTVHIIRLISLYDSSSTTASRHFLKDTVLQILQNGSSSATASRCSLGDTVHITGERLPGQLTILDLEWNPSPGSDLVLSQGSGHTPSFCFLHPSSKFCYTWLCQIFPKKCWLTDCLLLVLKGLKVCCRQLKLYDFRIFLHSY